MCVLSATGPTTYSRLRRCHTRAAIRHAVAVGDLRNPFHGAYVGERAPGWPAALTARCAQLSIGRDLPAAAHTAADIHGFGVLDDGAAHLVGAERFDHAPRPGLIVHSTARPPAVVAVAGVRTVTAARAAIDLARSQPAGDALAVLDAAMRAGVPPRGLAEELARHTGLRGVGRARRALAVADPRAESPQESRLRWVLIAGGLPPPELQITIAVSAGQVFRCDLGYRQQRVALEYDGSGHADRRRLRYDRARHNALVSLGWQVLYFTDWDVFLSPRATAERVAAVAGFRLPG